jgi:AbiV family abortive infection protein
MIDIIQMNAYRGMLSIQQITDGMNCAIENAIRLRDDAVMMFENCRYPTAFTLAVLAIEEYGKLSIFRRMSTASTDKDMQTLWKEFTQHTAKSIGWPALDSARAMLEHGPVKLDDLKPIFVKDAEHTKHLDRAKQFAMYVDCVGPKVWATPEASISEADAADIVRIATEHIGKRTRDVTVGEMVLWRDVVGPDATQERLVDWYAAMQREGLFPPGPNVMEQFVRRGLRLAGDE